MIQEQSCSQSLPGSILAAIDSSKFNEQVVDQAIAIAKMCKSELAIIHVIDANNEFIAMAPNIEQHLEAKAKKLLDAAKARAAEQDISCETIIEFDDQTYRPIVKQAAEKKVALIIIGSQGRSALGRIFMGSVCLRVVAHSPCPVLVLPCTSA